ncbi:hypothetical protein CC80DRAFT_309607 [Byssothecium circinans]|uniref:DAGKc domain-containing protein n=1 Tax=Byssothecium circinans TaxID=147558 RepID=A0A6A5U3P0_9PLEO|nr:hypothetical protein CC80DRAFT_309607 [Byssothecium circinans]
MGYTHIMSDSTETLTFKATTGEHHTIPTKNLIASIPTPDSTPSTSTILYLTPNPDDPTALPTLTTIQGDLSPTATPPATSDTETHIIISTSSGTKKASTFYTGILSPVLSTLFPKGHENFLVHYTTSADTVKELTFDIFSSTANAGIHLRIILLSGDGGVIDILNSLLAHPTSSQYKPPELILLPLGTANALFHSTHVGGKDDTWGLRTLVSSTTKPLPIFTATFSPGARLLVNEGRTEEELPRDPTTGHNVLHGAVVGSWGMHATLVADSDTAEYRKYGVERFSMAAKELLYPSDGSAPHVYKAQISLLKNDKWTPVNTSASQPNSHMYILLTLVSNLEKPFCISPATKPLDGSLHVVHFGPTTGDEAMRIMGLAYQGGKHVEEEMVTYEAVDGMRIEFRGMENIVV